MSKTEKVLKLETQIAIAHRARRSRKKELESLENSGSATGKRAEKCDAALNHHKEIIRSSNEKLRELKGR